MSGEPATLSREQRRVAALLALHGASPVFHRCAARWLLGPLDPDRIAAAVPALLRRHALLAADRGHATSPANVQPVAFERTIVDDAAAALRRAAIEFGRALDPGGLAWRICLIRADAGRHLLVVVVHGLLADEDHGAARLLAELLALATRDAPIVSSAQYTDYVATQDEASRRAHARGDVAWWSEQIAAAPAMLELATDRPRPALRSFVAHACARPLSLTTSELGRLAGDGSADVTAVALAGLLALLQRYTGQTELALAVPLALARSLASATPLASGGDPPLGPVGAPVLLRMRVDPHDSFAALLARTIVALAEAEEHGALAYLEAAEAQHRSAGAPLLQLRFQTSAAPHLPPGTGFTTSFAAPVTTHSGHELELGLDLDGERLHLFAIASADLFEQGTPERLLGHWEQLLAAAVAAPEQTIAALPLLTAAERATLADWNATYAELGPQPRVHALFEAQADRTPDAPAVVFAGEVLGYRALDLRASRLARRLRALGVGPDVPVGIHLERSLDLAIAVLGVLKAGGAYVPLDPTHPPARLAAIVDDTGLPVLVTREALVDTLPGLAVRRVLLEEVEADGPAGDARLSFESGQGDLAYILFTSGSTGRPKGIALPHVALVNLIEWHARTLLGGVATLQFAALGFDASFHEMFAAWATGGVVHIIDEAQRQDVARLAEYIETHALAKIILPVVVLQQLAQEYGERPQVLRSLREVTTTGEQMHLTAPVIALFEKLPDCALHNHYGPTESHVVTAYTLPRERRSWVPHPPIGRPIANSRTVVLDPHGNECPIGVPGELFLGGLCLARGYWRNPALTAERFLPDHLSDEPGARLYRSGDIARWRADGTLEYLGRRDHQVKIRGVRVELGEVEAAISRHPDVLETVVLAREDRPGERRLVAYVVLRAAEALAGLRAFLRLSLPEVMLPAAIVPLTNLPLTGNGKVDRRALPAPEAVPTPRSRPMVAPRNEIEAALASIWREVLRIDRIGVHDDFFELGGHSLAATQVFSRVRRIFAVEPGFQRLFQAPTIAALAAWIRDQRAPSRADAQIPAAPRDRPAPLSLAQERLWFLQRLAPDSTAYHCPYFFMVRGPVDAGALQHALDVLARRHEALRTRFVEIDGVPRQEIAAQGSIVLARHDLTALAPDERASQLREHLQAEATRRFDLERGPLLRAGLIALAGDEHVLWFNLHHIVIDGWSMDVLLRELAAVYADPTIELPALPLQLVDHAAWQRAHPTDPNAVAWWKARLAGAPPLLTIPGDRPRPAIQSSRGGALRFTLEPAEVTALRELAARRGATVAMVLLAAYTALLHRYTGESDLVIGVPISGRERVELEPVVGLFVNTLPLRIDLGGGLDSDPSFEALIDRVREVSLAAYDHDGVPFDRLVQELRPERTLGHNPIVQVGFAPQPTGEGDLALAGVRVEPLDVDAQKTVFDLTLYTWDDARGISGMLEYSADLFDRATIERMLGHLLALLRGAVARPEQHLGALSLLSASERRRVIVPSAPAAAPGLMHALFERQAARDPDHPAVILGDERLTHGALDRRANQLAHHLRGRGVGPETLVALSVERGFDLIVGVLGILKAGAAFVPLDPAYPADRIGFMLTDCGAAIVLTQATLADRFRDHPAVLRLDADWPQIAREREQAPEFPQDPGSAAYVIYTSGSTGRPKGVVIEHRGAVNLAHALDTTFALGPADVVLQFSAPSFDALVFELMTAWAVGATLCLMPPGLPVPGREFRELLRDRGVSMCLLPPSLLAVMDDGPYPALTHLVAGGEACSAALVDRWGPGRNFFNAYGPTETSVCASIARCTPGTGTPPIGLALAGVRLYVLDAHGEPCPLGVPGELHVGGAGVARGYLGRPELTAARFVADPFADAPQARMYRTGDRVRWRPDMQLEYLGRLDAQVKLRGFRVELGEIEAALREHPGVQDVAVVAGAELVAFVVAGSVGAASEQVETWGALYDDTYTGPTIGDPTFNITGWASSHTGLPIAAPVMRVWRDSTSERLAALQPTRVWEIGCGTGLLLLPLAGRCERYLGTDLSAAAIAQLQRQVDALGLRHVTLQQRAADDPPALAEPVDLVLLNSVAQYFPDAEYLRRVVAGAAARLVDGGVLFVGDLRGLPLLTAFHCSVQLAHAAADAEVARVRERVQRAVDGENELVVDPALFAELAAGLGRPCAVEVWLRRGREADEMTRFRCDVLLFVGPPAPAVEVDVTWLWGQVVGDLDTLADWLAAADLAAIELLAVPNARIAVDVAAARLLGEATGRVQALMEAAAAASAGAVEPEDLWRLGERLGWHVRVTPGDDLATFDVLFERGQPQSRPRPWSRARPRGDRRDTRRANDPVRARVQRQLAPALRSALATRLPAHMLPAAIVVLDALPVTHNGKVDRRALAERARRTEVRSATYTRPRSEVERTLVEIWREVLGVEQVGVDDPFFELGGHSLLLAQVRAAIAVRLGRELTMVELFQHPTIRQLAARLGPDEPAAQAKPITSAARPTPEGLPTDSIAIIGMAGRFPGAADVETLFTNLLAGVEGIVHSSREELLAAGVDPALVASPRYVPAFGLLADAEAFDAGFFGYSPQEARVMDPQQRVFLECAFAALEDAGHDPARRSPRVGVFAGSDGPHYWLERAGGGGSGIDEFQAGLGNVPDNLTARVAYKLGLTGPAVTVLSACSTSLVAVHMACQSLRAGECDAALAGGVAVALPSLRGHVYEEGGILSPDGHCRPFDSDARGTVGASGVAIVVLRRLADALADGDEIRAVIRGSAIGNDGGDKIGFTAPSARGQAEVLRRAHTAAAVTPASIGLIEAHGTATRLGDPIEVAALTEVFRASTDRTQFCALGSLKSNLGHLGAAAGVAGLIKATLALARGQIPPTLHYRGANPALQLATSPFFVNTNTLAWSGPTPRRAGVNAFGVGGTNAHVVLEQPPITAPTDPSSAWQLLPLSARSAEALAERTTRLAAHLRAHPDLQLVDVAHTLQRRPTLAPARSVVVGRDLAGAISGLETDSVHGLVRPREPKLVFVFPGAGSQTAGMARDLYTVPVFRAALDACAERFLTVLGEDIRALLLPSADAEQAAQRLLRPSLNFAAIFAVEHALARLVIAWGLRPAAVLGHSLGEYSAAQLAGVLSLDDAITLVAARGRLCDESPPAAMLAVPLPERDTAAWLDAELSLAAINGPDASLVAGPRAAIDRLAQRLAQAGIEARRLPVAFAGHSPLMDPFVPRLVARAREVSLHAPETPIVSGVTGTWLTDDARSPEHWGRHLRATVRFADAAATLLADPEHAFVELGPGGHLAGLIRRHPAAGPDRLIVSTMLHPRAGRPELAALQRALGQLWCAGVPLDWDAIAGGARRRIVPLPTYPFARTRHMLARGDRRILEPTAPAPTAPVPTTRTGRDPTTDALAEIWSQLLGVADVRPSDDFFALGGSSLVAIQLRAHVRERLGVSLPTHALVEAPTLAALAALTARAQDGPTPSPASLLVPLRPGSPDAAPLFLIQPIGGTVYTYLPLARALAWPGPILGIRASGLEPGEPVLEDMSRITSHYLEVISRSRPHGPVHLGGHSAGGVIAHAMAQQLEASGRCVTLLMIDAPSLPAIRAQAIGGTHDLLRQFECFATGESAAYHGLVTALHDDPALAQVMLATWRAMHGHTPRPISGEVHYIAAHEQRDPRDSHAGSYWMDLATGPFTLRRAPGDHFTMLDPPQVDTLARLIARGA